MTDDNDDDDDNGFFNQLVFYSPVKDVQIKIKKEYKTKAEERNKISD